MNVLILCTGNSCRSQMAHGFLQSLDQNIRVCSAGIRPAEKVHPLAVEVMSEVGIDIQYQFARFYTKEIKGRQLRLDEEARNKDKENIR